MTLLSICQDAADEIGIFRPGAVASSTDPDAQKLFRLANMVGNRLMKIYAWQFLRTEQTFTALGQEAQTAIIPSDFDRIIPETFWDRTNRYLVNGPITPVEWNGLKAVSYSDTALRKFIYRNNGVSVIPAFSGGESLAFEYVSKNWATDSGGTAQAKFLADTDLTLFDEDLHTAGLVYAYLEGEGLPSDSAKQMYDMHFKRLIDNDQPNSQIMVAGDIFGSGRHFTGTPPYQNTGSSVI